MKKGTRVSFAPLAYPGAKILILGSMPGERSLQMKQYYGHPMNQFWRVLQEIFGAGELRNYQSKKALLRDHGIAVWDVVKNCHRYGSSDLSIQKAKANDISGFLTKHPGIRHILLNGRAAEKYFVRFFGRAIRLPYPYVPSTSPAHAGLSFKTKLRLWKQAFTKAGIETGRRGRSTVYSREPRSRDRFRRGLLLGFFRSCAAESTVVSYQQSERGLP